MNTPSIFVSCPKNLETLLLQEIQGLGITQARLGHLGVFVDEMDLSTVYLLNYGLRLASRVLLPLFRFRCSGKEALYRQAKAWEWNRWIHPHQTFAIDAHVHQNPGFTNSLYAALVLKDAICDEIREKTGERPSVSLKDPDVQLHLFLQGEQAIVSLDTSGQPLYKRGYRQEGGVAPLQENLAAALLQIAGYRGQEALFDPCCGSGTILLEAALMATDTPPGYLRSHWGFMRHPDFVQADWLSVKGRLDAKRKSILPAPIGGVDISGEAILAAKHNIKLAQFSGPSLVQVRPADFTSYKVPFVPNLVVTNPPYGKRLGDPLSLQPLYRALGRWMKETLPKGGRGFLFTASSTLAKEVGLAAKRRHLLFQGSEEARLLEYDFF